MTQVALENRLPRADSKLTALFAPAPRERLSPKVAWLLTENQRKPRSVDTSVLSSRRFCNSILTCERSTVPEIVHYESKCLLSPMGFSRM